MKWEDSNYLEHYGVLGMKWGRRKQRVLVGRRRGARSTRSSTSHTVSNTSTRAAVRKDQKKQKLKKMLAISTAAIVGTAAVAIGYKFVKNSALKNISVAKFNAQTVINDYKKSAEMTSDYAQRIASKYGTDSYKYKNAANNVARYNDQISRYQNKLSQLDEKRWLRTAWKMAR